MSISYNSCRNRHCPPDLNRDQGEQKEAWIKAREAELLPVPYYHVVFTLPDTINPLCLYAPDKVYNLLFKTAWSVMQSFAADPKYLGARPGMIAILHTWGQNLSLHPHLHCIVPGGGVNKQGKWKHKRKKGKFLFPVKAMSPVFRARFVEGLRKEFPDQSKQFFNSLFNQKWVVYAKPAFGGPQSVVAYLGRYTHKIAISNHRIKSLDNEKVTFSYKDYRHGNIQCKMSLSDQEFIRRFSQHVLPKGFVRIRHFGFLSSGCKKEKLPLLQAALGVVILPVLVPEEPEPYRPCPACGKKRMLTVGTFTGRGPPSGLLVHLQSKLTSC